MTTGYVGPNNQWVSTADTPNQAAVAPSAPYTQLAAAGVIAGRPAVLLGMEVVVALGAGAVTVYDNASAASGNVLAVIPASAAVGALVDFATGIQAVAGLYADFASTGTVNFIYQ